MKYKSVTIDTCVWLSVLDSKSTEASVLLDACMKLGITIYVSSRVNSFDTVKMRSEQQERLEELKRKYGAKITPAPFMFGSVYDEKITGSTFGGVDFLGDLNESHRDKEFTRIVGQHPTKNPGALGSKASNHIGDYDSLRQHYLSKIDAYITSDTKVYFSEVNRRKYKDSLELIIISPEEFLNDINSILKIE